MLFLARNHDLVRDREKTYLTASSDVAATTITVRAVDSNAWADNDWIIVGEIGTKNAEILQINGAVSDGTSLTIDNAGSGGARFAHAVNEPVYRTPYNQIEFSRATTITGAKSVLATNELQVDESNTRYEDTANTTGFGFVRFYNSLSGGFSDYSDAIPYTGYTAKSLGRIMKMVRRHLNEYDVNVISDEDIVEETNEKQRDIAHERLWSFYEDIFSDSRVAYQREYDIDSDVVTGKVHTVTVESEPLAKIDAHRFDILHWDAATTGEPTHCSVWNNKLRFYPTPDAAASTTAINDATDITATDTTITIDDSSGFSPSGRVIIDDEVIGYTNITSTSLLGCTRGLEGTTAAAHLDDATVTERDIVYTAHKEPTELTDIQDETQIPDPLVLVYGVSMELAIGILEDETKHDRLKVKYDQALDRLRDKFGKKMTVSSFRIKDKDEVVSDMGKREDPNNNPVIS